MLLFKLPGKDILERLENNVMHRNVFFLQLSEVHFCSLPPPQNCMFQTKPQRQSFSFGKCSEFHRSSSWPLLGNTPI